MRRSSAASACTSSGYRKLLRWALMTAAKSVTAKGSAADAEDVGAEVGDLLLDVEVGALHEGHDGDQRGDPHGQAEHRERGAEFVRANGVGREREVVAEPIISPAAIVADAPVPVNSPRPPAAAVTESDKAPGRSRRSGRCRPAPGRAGRHRFATPWISTRSLRPSTARAVSACV